MRILIAEDQKSVRENIELFLNRIPGMEIVGFAENGEIAIQKAEELHPDIVLVDLFMPVMDGLTTTAIIADRFKTTKVLIITGVELEQESYLTKALIAGAKGYLLKKNLTKNLINALQIIQKGSLYLSPIVEEIELFNSLSTTQNFKLAPLTDWLAKEILFQWCKQPIGESVFITDIVESLGIKPEQNQSNIVAFLEKTGNNTTLSSELLSKIEQLKAQQTTNRPTYSISELRQAAKTIENWFQSPNDFHSFNSLTNLPTNVKFLHVQTLNIIRDRMTRLLQKAGTEPLLKFLQELEVSLENAAEEYNRIQHNYLFKKSSAWRAYNKLVFKLDTEKKHKKENWEAAWNALKLTYKFELEAKIYHYARQLVNQYLKQIQMYCQTLTATYKMLENLQAWFAKQSPLPSVLLPSLLVHLANEIDYYQLRNQFELQTGHFLNQWSASTSVSEELLREKITVFVRPIALQIYVNSCRQALSFPFLNSIDKSSRLLNQSNY